MTQALYQRSPKILFAELGTDVVALQIELGHCYGMQDGAAAIWNLLTEPIGIEQMVERLTEAYDVEPAACREDVERIVGQLRQEGMVIVRNSDESAT